jgi:hypothetical protein
MILYVKYGENHEKDKNKNKNKKRFDFKVLLIEFPVKLMSERFFVI